MGFFDSAIMKSTTFKTTADGRRVFFPWGRMGRSYEVESEQDYQTLQQRITLWVLVASALTVGVIKWQGFLAGGIVAVVMLAFYVGWMRYLLPGLRPSNEKL